MGQTLDLRLYVYQTHVHWIAIELTKIPRRSTATLTSISVINMAVYMDVCAMWQHKLSYLISAVIIVAI